MNKLQNNHNVYILGAGFSADRGLPVIKNFMHVMRDAHQWLESQGRSKEANAIRSVMEFRLDAASAAYRVRMDLENIEELFSLASASSRKLTDAIRLAIAATLDYKLKTSFEPKVGFQASSLAEIPKTWEHEMFDGFVSSEPHHFTCPAYEFFLTCLLGNWKNKNNYSDNSFITFNYDLIVEDALKKLSIPFNYGFSTKSEETRNGVSLLKLHGSLNWGKIGSSTNYKIYDSYDELRINQEIPQLVPPTWRKIFTGPLRQVWDQSLKSLENATRIIVIGFSIPTTDNHFKYLVAAGLQNNISLREIIFVNPNQAEIEQRANDLFGEITKLSSVKIIGYGINQFLSQGFVKDAIGSYGRPIPSHIQNIHFKQTN